MRPGYIALEVFDGVIGGRSGTSAFHQLGTMHGEAVELRYAVVPGSGTADLVGATGTVDLEVAGGVHTVTVTFQLPD